MSIARSLCYATIAALLAGSCRYDQFSPPTLALGENGVLVVSVANGASNPTQIKDLPHFLLSAKSRAQQVAWGPINLQTRAALHANESAFETVPSGKSTYLIPQQNIRWAMQRSSVWPDRALNEVASPGEYTLSVVAFGSRSNEIAVVLGADGHLAVAR